MLTYYESKMLKEPNTGDCFLRTVAYDAQTRCIIRIDRISHPNLIASLLYVYSDGDFLDSNMTCKGIKECIADGRWIPITKEEFQECTDA